jgi:hypothetical protein
MNVDVMEQLYLPEPSVRHAEVKRTTTVTTTFMSMVPTQIIIEKNVQLLGEWYSEKVGSSRTRRGPHTRQTTP